MIMAHLRFTLKNMKKDWCVSSYSLYAAGISNTLIINISLLIVAKDAESLHHLPDGIEASKTPWVDQVLVIKGATSKPGIGAKTRCEK